MINTHVFSWLVLPVFVKRRVASQEAELGLDQTSRLDRLRRRWCSPGSSGPRRSGLAASRYVGAVRRAGHRAEGDVRGRRLRRLPKALIVIVAAGVSLRPLAGVSGSDPARTARSFFYRFLSDVIANGHGYDYPPPFNGPGIGYAPTGVLPAGLSAAARRARVDHAAHVHPGRDDRHRRGGQPRRRRRRDRARVRHRPSSGRHTHRLWWRPPSSRSGRTSSSTRPSR